MDVAKYTMTNALFNAEIKDLQLHCIFFEDKFFKLMKVKGDGDHIFIGPLLHISCHVVLIMFGQVDLPLVRSLE